MSISVWGQASDNVDVYSGAAPVEAVDTDDYEVGSRFTVTHPVVITQIKVWNPGIYSRAGRTVNLWEQGVGLMTSAAAPAQLSAGWNYVSITPTWLKPGVTYIASYNVGGGASNDYGTVASPGFPITGGVVSISTGITNLTPATEPDTTADNYYGVEPTYES